VIPFLQVSDTPDADIVPVDCATCPINMSCLTGRSGTGWRFDCCGSAVMSLGVDTVMVDCQINEFRDDRRSTGFGLCPLCSGSIMEAVELARLTATVTKYYLPTVHAKIPLASRLITLRERHQAAKDRRALARSIENEEG
jgi:hypothetical protein